MAPKRTAVPSSTQRGSRWKNNGYPPSCWQNLAASCLASTTGPLRKAERSLCSQTDPRKKPPIPSTPAIETESESRFFPRLQVVPVLGFVFAPSVAELPSFTSFKAHPGSACFLSSPGWKSIPQRRLPLPRAARGSRVNGMLYFNARPGSLPYGIVNRESYVKGEPQT